MNKNYKILILTALPFKLNGNQSLIRFIRMFLSKNISVDLYSSANSKTNNNKFIYKNFTLENFFSLHEIILKLKTLKNKDVVNSNKKDNIFLKIKSEDILPPFGKLNFKKALSKWLLYLIFIIDNLILTAYFVIFKNTQIKKYSLIVGYECGYTLSAKLISKIYKIKYVNKYQGTILKSVGTDILKAVIFYPYNFFGINKSNLCIMVDDGTNGDYYAKVRGCKNIFFEPHGVATKDYDKNACLFNLNKYNGKFIIFNNASGSSWKRVDRIIRALQYIPKKVQKKFIFLTTYNAPDKVELIEFTKQLQVNDCVEFLHDIDYKTSNYLIRNSKLLIMTNDMSNLGNPVLEAIYYGIPIISINDGSINKYLNDGKNCILINLDENFDKNLANMIKKCVLDQNFYNTLLENSNHNNTIHTLDEQQKEEFSNIIKLLT